MDQSILATPAAAAAAAAPARAAGGGGNNGLEDLNVRDGAAVERWLRANGVSEAWAVPAAAFVADMVPLEREATVARLDAEVEAKRSCLAEAQRRTSQLLGELSQQRRVAVALSEALKSYKEQGPQFPREAVESTERQAAAVAEVVGRLQRDHCDSMEEAKELAEGARVAMRQQKAELGKLEKWSKQARKSLRVMVTAHGRLGQLLPSVTKAEVRAMVLHAGATYPAVGPLGSNNW